MRDEQILPVPYFGTALFWANLIQNLSVCTPAFPFNKQTYINRTIISGPNKIQLLSVPCSLKFKNQPLSETEVVYREKWPLIHLRSITAAYGKSPYFEYYWPEISPIISSGETNLGILNLKTLLKISELIKIPVKTDNGIKNPNLLNYHDFEKSVNFETYRQVFSERYPFAGNLSILDVLFNLGPETRAYLMRQASAS